MRTRLGGEAGPGPVRMPGLQLEPGQLSHEVKLGRPDVAVRAAGQPSPPALIEREVVRYNALTQNVVGVQADVAGLAMPDRGLLPGWQLAQLRYPELDHEAAARCEVAGGIAEARDLLGLGEQVEIVL